jgi:hypothetical protein
LIIVLIPRHYFKKNVDSGERVFLYKRGQFQFGERVKHFLPSGNTGVVFNASHKTNNNQSINDNLLVGPKLQQDLFCILIRFRIHKIIITADIKKMYRQIQLHSDHRKYQQIFWRNTPDEPVKTYQLHTVTYGFASSSFLAARCLQELASAEEKSHPKAAEVILRDFYVDDLITGADTVDNANAILKEINTVLNKGGFELHKIQYRT